MQSRRYLIFDTAWGKAALVAHGKKICASHLHFEHTRELRARLAAEHPDATPADESDTTLHEGARQVREYFEGARRAFSLPLDLSGFPPFHGRVYRALLTVKFGDTISYGALAAKAGSPRAARAVGRAMAANRLAPMVPCHRVVGADGSLTGFSSSGGLDEKKKMLLMEGADLAAAVRSRRRRPISSSQ